MDEVYLFVTKKIIFRYISKPVAWFDRHIIDGTMNGIAWIITFFARKIRNFQSGQVQQYGFVFFSGVVILAIVFILFW